MRIRWAYLVASVVLVQAVLAGPAVAWDFPRGPASGTGATLAEQPITAENVHSLTRIWARGSSGGYRGGVTAAGGRVFYGTGTDYLSGGPGHVVARRETTGRLLWRTGLPGETYSTPVYHDGRVFVLVSQVRTQPSGRLYALSARSGRMLWWFGVAGSGYDVPISPVVHRGLVFMEWGDSNATLTALDEGSGAVVWNHRHQLLGSTLAFADGYLITGSLLYAPDTGKLVGSLPGREGVSQAIVTPEAVYTLAPFNEQDRPRMLVSAFPLRCVPSTSRCSPIWRRWISGTTYGALAVASHRVVVPVYYDTSLGAGAVVALGARAGHIVWRWTAPPGVAARDVSVAGNVAYLTTWLDSYPHHPRFYAFALTGCGHTDCPALNSWPTGRQGISSEAWPVIDNGIVFIWNDWQDGLWAFAPS